MVRDCKCRDVVVVVVVVVVMVKEATIPTRQGTNTDAINGNFMVKN